MEFLNPEPPLLRPISRPDFGCGPDRCALSIFMGCHGHVTLLPPVPGRELNHYQPKQPNQDQLKPTRPTKTITNGPITAGDGSADMGFGAETHLREVGSLPRCSPRRRAECGHCQFTHEFPRRPEKKGVVVLGISKDTPKAQTTFKENQRLPYTLLCDVDKKVVEAYGVWKEKNMYGKKVMGIERTTFVIDERGKIQKIFSKVKPAGHAAEVLAAL